MLKKTLGRSEDLATRVAALTLTRARARTAMPPNDDRSGDACESGRSAPDARRTDSYPLFAFAVEPIPSNEKLERYASFTDALRDALGELRRAKELSPDEAAERGCLSTLRSLHRRGHAELTADLCAAAARGGQFEVLEWLRENECPWDFRTCAEAAKGGHLEVVKWARAKGCPWDEWTCAYAARAGHLDVLKWACAKGCPWDGTTCEGAAREGHLEVLQWATENGALWLPSLCKFAADRGHHHVMDWIVKNAEAYERDYVLEWYDMYVGDDDGIDQGT